MLQSFGELDYTRSAETAQAEMSFADIVYSLQHDGAFFIQFFMAEELTHAIPEFHLQAWALLTCSTAPYVALALPRGHAKTTLMKLACVWMLLFTPARFIVYLSNTHSIAAEACKDIIGYIESDNFRSVFGAAIFETRQESHAIYKFRITVNTPQGLVDKLCILRAFGASQQVRGINVDNTRPELAIVDDLEDDENTATELAQNKMKIWFYGAFMKALTRRNPRVLYAGNMLSNKSILYFIVVKSQRWHSMRFGCLKSDGKPLWPDMWSLAAIREDFLEYQRLKIISRWFAEMMNMPMAPEGGLIKDSEIIYAVAIQPGEHEMAFITVDPQISKETWGNDCAIVVHACLNGVWRIADYLVGKYDPGDLFLLLVGLCHKWNTRIVGVESAGFQKVLKFVFEILSQVHKQSFDYYEIPHRNRSKTERLIAWCAVVKKGIWTLQEGDFAVTEQLLAYDPLKTNNDDDLIDACSMGVTMVELYMEKIIESFSMKVLEYQPRTGVETMAL